MDLFIIVFIIIICALITTVIAIAVVRFIYFYLKEEFVCPECKYKFKPKVFKLIFTAHIGRLNYLRCPKCNKINWMDTQKVEKS